MNEVNFALYLFSLSSSAQLGSRAIFSGLQLYFGSTGQIWRRRRLDSLVNLVSDAHLFQLVKLGVTANGIWDKQFNIKNKLVNLELKALIFWLISILLNFVQRRPFLGVVSFRLQGILI